MNRAIRWSTGAALVLLLGSVSGLAYAGPAKSPRSQQVVSRVKMQETIQKTEKLMEAVSGQAPAVDPRQRRRADVLMRDASARLQLAQDLAQRSNDPKSRRLAVDAAERAHRKLKLAEGLLEEAR